MLNNADNENRFMLEIHHTGSHEDFSGIDNNLQCYNENEDCEGAAVDQTEPKHQNTSEDQESKDDDTTELERVTNQDARKCTVGLRLHEAVLV
jgi:hypothetical protein